MCSTLQRQLEVEFLHVGEMVYLNIPYSYLTIFIANNFDFREYFAAYKIVSIVSNNFYTDYHRFPYRHASYFIQHKIHNILKPEVSEYEAVYIPSVLSKHTVATVI